MCLSLLSNIQELLIVDIFKYNPIMSSLTLTGRFDLAVMVSMRLRGTLSSRMTSGHGRTSERVSWNPEIIQPAIVFSPWPTADSCRKFLQASHLLGMLSQTKRDSRSEGTRRFLRPLAREQSVANVHVSGLTLKLREIRNIQRNPGATGSSLAALYLILH